MATAPSLADKINNNFLKCGICLEPFKNPRGLPCLHSFCEECLERWAAKSKKKGKSKEFACPNCMKLTSIPAEGIQGFPAHFLVNSLQETVNMEKKAEACAQKLCTKCKNPDAKVVVYCSDCDQFFCKTCYQSDDSHSPWGAMKLHRAISVEDLEAGKVSVPEQTATSEQYCAEHEEEQCKFYCKTCGKLVCRDCIIMKQRCRDHDYVTLKEASSKRYSKVQELMETCNKTRKHWGRVLEKHEDDKSKLVESLAKVKADLDQGEKDYIEQVRNAYAQQAKRVEQDFNDKDDGIDANKSSITEGLQELDAAYKEGQSLLGTKSHSQIISKFPTVHNSLEQVICRRQFQIPEHDDSSVGNGGYWYDIATPVTSMHLGPRWEQCREIKLPNPVSSDNGPAGIALTSKNKLAIRYFDCAKIFSSSGKEEHCFDMPDVASIAVDSEDEFVLTLNDHCNDIINMHVYDTNFKLNKKFTLSNRSDYAVKLIVDKNGNAIVGTDDAKITIVDIESGSEKSILKVGYWPLSLTISAPGEMAVTYTHQFDYVPWEKSYHHLKTIDYSGNTLNEFSEPPEVSDWCPSCVCASKKYEVFVVNTGEPKGIYKFSAGGEYMGCVTTEVNIVWGIALSHDDQELYVTEYDDQVIKVFKRPQI